MSAANYQLVLGLPGAGKTTFLAALRQVTAANDVPGALRLVSLGADDAHVNAIHDRWLDCQSLGRTLPTQEHTICLRLGDDKTNAVFDLEIPDLSGELIDQQWTLRRYAETYPELVRRASAILLFVHAGTVIQATPIADANLIIAAVGQETEGAGAPAPQPPNKPEKYDPAGADTQVRLVEILQFVAHLRESALPLPLAVVVSAWDRVPKTQARPLDPTGWLRNRLPLLHQYLDSNAELFTLRVFGLSAQGGDLRDDKERLLRLSPSQRINVVNEGVSSSDITLPMRWLARQAGLAL